MVCHGARMTSSYAMTIAGWREPDGGRVLRVDPGAGPGGGPLHRTAAHVVIDWLEGGGR